MIQVHPAVQRWSSSTILSTINMTDWRSIGAVSPSPWDDTTAVLDSCSLKRGMRTSQSVKEEKRQHKAKARTFSSSLP